MSTYLTWTLFILVVAGVGLGDFGPTEGGVLHVDGLAQVMWIAVTFFSGIVQSFSRRYMAADRHQARFFGRILLFTVAVLVMTAANHVALFLGAWTAMGLVMARLIGHVERWEQATEAGRIARRYFLAGSVLLSVGVSLLVVETNATTITGVVEGLDAVSAAPSVLATGFVLAAAFVQSALLPFHRWLLSSMTAPTPSSALMHAGFVNAGGVLLSRFAPLFAGETNLMLLIVVAGVSSSLVAQAMMLVQPTYKGRLGCSTIAQMGFMILQCGLGFFAAAVTHLIVHGFYKAYLFLSTGSQVEATVPTTTNHDGIDLGPRAVALVTAIAGGAVFAILSGKGLDPTSTGIFLTVVVVIALFQGASQVLADRSLSPLVRLFGLPVVALPAIALYALCYNAVSGLMHDVPLVHAPMEMSAAHWALLGLFVVGHVAVELGWLQRSQRLYVALLNATQPDSRTIPARHRDMDAGDSSSS
ncbi:proton-conducting transporter membrane subunit [Haloplanus halobius]|uniref:proton-conducting transporter transmembrane domain-containing protein n=1 Tax=Haloplanus halobius TaxID=2934938 RepID=UPI00200D6CF8